MSQAMRVSGLASLGWDQEAPVALLGGSLEGQEAADVRGALGARQVGLLRKALRIARQEAKLLHEGLLGHVQAILAICKLHDRPAAMHLP